MTPRICATLVAMALATAACGGDDAGDKGDGATADALAADGAAGM